ARQASMSSRGPVMTVGRQRVTPVERMRLRARWISDCVVSGMLKSTPAKPWIWISMKPGAIQTSPSAGSAGVTLRITSSNSTVMNSPFAKFLPEQIIGFSFYSQRVHKVPTPIANKSRFCRMTNLLKCGAECDFAVAVATLYTIQQRAKDRLARDSGGESRGRRPRRGCAHSHLFQVESECDIGFFRVE